MSFDAVTWAKAQKAPTARAKSVLICLAAYADVEGFAWAAVPVLTLETCLGNDRTVQRGLADLKDAGLLIDTGEKRVWKSKLYPIYRLPIEVGPANTRERMALERELGVTPVSPQEGAGEARGDTSVTPSGDTSDGLGVTPVSPKQEDNPPFGREENLNPGVREAAARLAELERICPKSMLRFYDQPLALAALIELLGEGLEADLVAVLERMGKHPDFRSRKHPPQLHDWLRKRGFIGWLEEDPSGVVPVAAPAASVAPQTGAAEEAEQLVWNAVLAQLREVMEPGEFGSYIGRAYLGADGLALFVVAANGIARDWIARRCWKRLLDYWGRTDRAKRPLRLVSRSEFEALVERQQGVN